MPDEGRAASAVAIGAGVEIVGFAVGDGHGARDGVDILASGRVPEFCGTDAVGDGVALEIFTDDAASGAEPGAGQVALGTQDFHVSEVYNGREYSAICPRASEVPRKRRRTPLPRTGRWLTATRWSKVGRGRWRIAGEGCGRPTRGRGNLIAS